MNPKLTPGFVVGSVIQGLLMAVAAFVPAILVLAVSGNAVIAAVVACTVFTLLARRLG